MGAERRAGTGASAGQTASYHPPRWDLFTDVGAARETYFLAMHDNLMPFHQQAEEEGQYVLEDRSRDAERRRPVERPEGPSENND
jgi:hypothetical protein